jgi:hypothetical protein
MEQTFLPRKHLLSIPSVTVFSCSVFRVMTQKNLRKSGLVTLVKFGHKLVLVRVA